MKLKNYYKPTPKKWRRIGDALLAVSLYAQTQDVLSGNSKIMNGIAISALVGKFLTNFFADDEQPKEQKL